MRTEYDGFTVDPLTPTIGAEITGLNLADVGEGLAATIHDAWMDWKVLFFRGQDITPSEHIAFARHFSELEIHPFLPDDGEHPELVVFDSEGSGPYKANYWHTDVTFRERPPMGSILAGRVIPAVGGDTCWIDMERVYEDLDDETKELLEGRTALHTLRIPFANRDPEELERQLEIYPDQHHPVIRTHPVTGRRCLFLNRSFVESIDDMEPTQSDELLTRLVGHSTYGQLEHLCRFRWRPGSVAMWDNRCTQHYAVFDYSEHRRVERVTLEGDVPA